MAWLFPVPQYAIAIVYIPLRRKTGSLSFSKLVTSASLSSNRLNIVNEMPTAKPRKIFSWPSRKCIHKWILLIASSKTVAFYKQMVDKRKMSLWMKFKRKIDFFKVLWLCKCLPKTFSCHIHFMNSRRSYGYKNEELQKAKTNKFKSRRKTNTEE